MVATPYAKSDPLRPPNVRMSLVTLAFPTSPKMLDNIKSETQTSDSGVHVGVPANVPNK